MSEINKEFINIIFGSVFHPMLVFMYIVVFTIGYFKHDFFMSAEIILGSVIFSSVYTYIKFLQDKIKHPG